MRTIRHKKYGEFMEDELIRQLRRYYKTDVRVVIRNKKGQFSTEADVIIFYNGKRINIECKYWRSGFELIPAHYEKVVGSKFRNSERDYNTDPTKRILACVGMTWGQEVQEMMERDNIHICYADEITHDLIRQIIQIIHDDIVFQDHISMVELFNKEFTNVARDDGG